MYPIGFFFAVQTCIDHKKVYYDKKNPFGMHGYRPCRLYIQFL